MSILIMTCDWTVVERFQTYFSSQFANGNLIWAAHVTPSMWQHQPLELVVFDSRMSLTLAEFPWIQKLQQGTPTLWLEFGEGGSDANDIWSHEVLGDEVVKLRGDQLSASAAVRGRQRAIAMHQARQKSEIANPLDSRNLAQALEQLIRPMRIECRALRQALGRLHPHGQDSNEELSSDDAQTWGMVTSGTDRLASRLNQVDDLISLLGNQHTCHRQAFSLEPLVRQVAREIPLARLCGRSLQSQVSLEPTLAFADPQQIRSCLSEILVTLSHHAAGQVQGPLMVDLKVRDHQWSVVVAEEGTHSKASEIDPVTFDALRRLWRQQNLLNSCRHPAFFADLGLTRERARHNGGDLDLHLSADHRLEIELTLPRYALTSVLTSYQRFLASELPDLGEVSFIWINVSGTAPYSAQLDSAQSHPFAPFIQSRLNSLALAMPFEAGNWLLIAPIDAAEQDSFTDWLLQEWDAHFQNVSVADTDSGSTVLTLSKMTSAPGTAPIATWAVEFQKNVFQKQHDALQDVGLQEVVEQVGEDNRRLHQNQTSRPAVSPRNHHTAVPRPYLSPTLVRESDATRSQ